MTGLGKANNGKKQNKYEHRNSRTDHLFLFALHP
jgi:hypothetical protein